VTDPIERPPDAIMAVQDSIQRLPDAIMAVQDPIEWVTDPTTRSSDTIAKHKETITPTKIQESCTAGP